MATWEGLSDLYKWTQYIIYVRNDDDDLNNNFLTQIIIADEVHYFKSEVDNSRKMCSDFWAQQSPFFTQMGRFPLCFLRFHDVYMKNHTI